MEDIDINGYLNILKILLVRINMVCQFVKIIKEKNRKPTNCRGHAVCFAFFMFHSNNVCNKARWGRVSPLAGQLGKTL